MNNKLIIYLSVFLFFLKINVYSQELPSYNLEGYLSPGDFEILLIFRLYEENDSLFTKMYVPEQGIFAMKANSTYIKGDSLFIHYEREQITYRSLIDIDNNRLDGRYIQGRNDFPLILDFIDDEDAVSFDRPQYPKEPFSYITQEHSFFSENSRVTLAGTLFLPDTISKHKLAIITTGGGAPGRNEMFGGHHVFLVLADFLAENGIAAFIYDERGAGKSSGRFVDNTTRTYMTDALNILDYFQNHDNIKSDKIGFVGHSEGALAAIKAAAINRNDVAFVVSLAGPGVPIVEMLKKQAEDIFRLSNEDEEKIEILIEYRKKLFDTARTLVHDQSLRRTINAITDDYAKLFSEEDAERFGLNEVGAHQFISQVRSTWLSYFLQLEPARYLERIVCPFLAIGGDKDIQVHAESNLKAMEKVLKEAGHENYQIIFLEGYNHIFQKAENGSVKEYMFIQTSFCEDVLKIIVDFISEI